MLRLLRQGNLLPIAAVVTWAAVSGFAFYLAWLRDGANDALYILLPLALANLAGMWIAMDNEPSRMAMVRAGLTLQLLSALLAGWLVPLSFMPMYTVVWISMVGGSHGIKVTRWLLLGVLAAWYMIMRFGWGESDAIFTVLLYGTFHLFALLSTHNAHLAETARDQVEALNRELLATQHLLSEASRQGERTRIARNLHDLLGHHLTALSINLQIAEHMTEGEARDKVAEARALARLLLSDVREAVSTLRQEGTVDLERAISLLIDNVPTLEVSLDIAKDLAINDVEIAEAVLRCVQESLTNTLRHAGATRSWIRVWQEAGHVHLQIHDNGVFHGKLQAGNGIAGIRERIQQLQGQVTVDAVNQSLQIRADIPVNVA